MQFVQVFMRGVYHGMPTKTWKVNFASWQFSSYWHSIPSERMIRYIGNNPNIMTHSHVKAFSQLSRGKLPFDKLCNLTEDVLLFSYEKTKILKLLAYFGVAQLAFWAYLGKNLYSNLRDIKKAPKSNTGDYLSKHPLWRTINLGEKKYRITALVCCLAVGVTTAFITFALPLRIVRHLVLCKGGSKVSIATYGPFGRTRQINVPLHHLDCRNSRSAATSYISLKIKGYWLYFLLDCRGKFSNEQLFDFTVGTTKSKLY